MTFANKPSKLDCYISIIKEKLSIKGVTRKGVYEYILNEVDSSIGTYSNFLKYLKKHDLKPENCNNSRKGYPRYETQYGRQAQADWKEDVHITNRYGEIFTLQIFNYKLGASRYCVFTPRLERTRQSVIECLIRSFRMTGGVPTEILFDNMSSIVTFSGKTRNVSSEFKAFADDFGFKIRFARARSPYTKGKVEAANKMIEWVLPYEGQFETYDELVEIVEHINTRACIEVCQATGVTPLLLLQKEKEYLQKMPSDRVIESYLDLDVQRKVGKDSLIMYNDCRYSVPPEYIGRTVSIQIYGGEFLRIFYHNEMIREHKISQKKINYCREDYRQMLTPLVHDENMIEELADRNLMQMDEFL